MKYQYKHISGTFKMILLLCLCGFVFSGMPQQQRVTYPIVDDVTLKTVTVYIGESDTRSHFLQCIDTLVIDDINLRVRRTDSTVRHMKAGGDYGRFGWLLLTDIDTLHFYYRSPIFFWWKKGNDFYVPIIDSITWQRLNNTIESFEASPASCLSGMKWALDVTLETAIVYLGGEGTIGCPDTLIIDNINMRVRRTDHKLEGYAIGFGDGIRGGWLLLTDTDTLKFRSRPVIFSLENGMDHYRPIIDWASRQKFNDIIVAFEKSDSSCLYKEWEEMWLRGF